MTIACSTIIQLVFVFQSQPLQLFSWHNCEQQNCFKILGLGSISFTTSEWCHVLTIKEHQHHIVSVTYFLGRRKKTVVTTLVHYFWIMHLVGPSGCRLPTVSSTLGLAYYQHMSKQCVFCSVYKVVQCFLGYTIPGCNLK